MSRLWDGWMRDMSVSYARILEHISKQNLAEAHKECAESLNRTVMRLYWQAATTYPARFRGVEDWCGWTRSLVIRSRQAMKDLELAAREEDSGKRDALKDRAVDSLDRLRAHTYALHAETGTMATNDVVYALWREARDGEPAPEQLKRCDSRFEEAPPSQAVRDDEAVFRKALQEWRSAVTPLLQDDLISEEETLKLREATRALYMRYGVPFE